MNGDTAVLHYAIEMGLNPTTRQLVVQPVTAKPWQLPIEKFISMEWVSVRKTQLQCISNGVASFLH